MDNPSLVLDGSGLADPAVIAQVLEDFKRDLDGSQGSVGIDLRKHSKVYSQAIAVVIGLHKECAQRGRKFTVLLVDNDVLFLFKSLKLDRILDLQIDGPSS